MQVFEQHNQIYLIFVKKNWLFAQTCDRKFGGNPPRRGRGVPKLQNFVAVARARVHYFYFFYIFPPFSPNSLIANSLIP